MCRRALGMFEGVSKLTEFRFGHADGAACFPPLGNGLLHVGEDCLGAFQRNPEVRRDRHQVLDRRGRSGVFGNPGLELADAFGGGIQVKRGRQAP